MWNDPWCHHRATSGSTWLRTEGRWASSFSTSQVSLLEYSANFVGNNKLITVFQKISEHLQCILISWKQSFWAAFISVELESFKYLWHIFQKEIWTWEPHEGLCSILPFTYVSDESPTTIYYKLHNNQELGLLRKTQSSHYVIRNQFHWRAHKRAHEN